MILPDLKWDQKTNRDLHCTALVNDRSLHSLRDLNSDHIPLLENLLNNGKKAIVKKYGFKVCKFDLVLEQNSLWKNIISGESSPNVFSLSSKPLPPTLSLYCQYSITWMSNRARPYAARRHRKYQDKI